MTREARRLPLSPTDIMAVVVSTVAVLFVLAFGGKLFEGYRLQRHNAMLSAEIEMRKQKRQELLERLDYVKTAAYVEEVAREQYKWVKAGENLVITVFRSRPAAQPASTSPTGSAPARTVAPADSHWSEWWNLLTGRAPNP